MTDRIEEDRITYFEGEFTKYGEPVIDELVLHNALVHLECLSDSCYMLIADNGKHYWHLTIHSKGGRAKVVARVYEDNSEGQSSQLLSHPLPDEGLRETIFKLIEPMVASIAPEHHPNVVTYKILTLLQQRVEQERERIRTIISDWDEMGQIADGGATWKAKYGSYFTPFKQSYIEELVLVIRQALNKEGG